MKDLESTNEEVNDRLGTALKDPENKENDLKENIDLLKTKEFDLNQIATRFSDLQAEYEDLQSDKVTSYQTENQLQQTILTLKAEKDEAKEFLEVLKKQNDELIRQLEEITLKL